MYIVEQPYRMVPCRPITHVHEWGFLRDNVPSEIWQQYDELIVLCDHIHSTGAQAKPKGTLYRGRQLK